MNYIAKNTLSEYMDKVLDNSVDKTGLSSRTHRSRNEWDRSVGFDGAVKLQKEGWDERPDLSKLADSIETSGQVEIATPATTYDVQGSYVDVPTYLEGVPECMVDFVEETSRKVVRIAFNISTSFNMTDKAFTNRGAVTLAVVRKLIEAGYSVELIAFQYCKPSGGKDKKGIYLQQIIIKEADQLIDEDSIAFWCCHPAALRRLGFSAKESMTEEQKQHFGVTRDGGYMKPMCAHDNSKVLAEIDADCIIDIKTHNFDKAVEEYKSAINHLNQKLDK